MFESFLARYAADDQSVAAPWSSAALSAIPDLAAITGRWGGASFNSGLYRVHTESSSRSATAALKPYLGEAWNDAIAFAFDWLGRNFAVSPRLWSAQNPLVYLVDLGEGAAFELPASPADLHDRELVEYADDVVAANWFSQWRAAHNGRSLEFTQCVGFRRPLFLGGTDGDDNLEVIDVDVYWSLTSQLYGKTKDLPVGTSVAGVTIEPESL